MPRIYCPCDLSVQTRWSLPDQAAKHVQVLRIQPGDEIILFNGSGGEFKAFVLEMSRKEVWVAITHFMPTERESPLHVHIAIGMPANERMDWLIEKATELGVSELTPLMTQRSVLRLSLERGDKKLQHWRAVAQAACTQCARNTLPVIHPPETFDSWLLKYKHPFLENFELERPTRELWYFSLDPSLPSLAQVANAHISIPDPPVPLLTAFGPEGGWSCEEEELLVSAGFKAITLGPRTLRSETAAIATLATLSSLVLIH
jgi:16S rRNA (uracil1498-N3)-methyltransferase